jgi:hypothetical protein
VFENRPLDNVLGRLYGPGDGKTFDGVTGKDLTNPIPEWAENGADQAATMDGFVTDYISFDIPAASSPPAASPGRHAAVLDVLRHPSSMS